MLLLGEDGGDVVESLLLRLNSRAEALLTHLPPTGRRVTLAPRQYLYAGEPRGRLFVVREGLLCASRESRVMFVLQPGDVAGIEARADERDTDYFSEDGAVLDAHEFDDFQALLRADSDLGLTWQNYLFCLSSLFAVAFGHQVKDQHRPQAGFLRFKSGDVIIREGEEADAVYTLMKGKARAFLREQEVGVIREGEIFGALAVLTHSRRIATVVADAECTVMAVPGNQFAGLLKAHPETCLHLLESMARTIEALNARVVSPRGVF